MKLFPKEKLRYRFEKFMSKGGSSIFLSLFIVFLIGFFIVIGLRFALIYFFPNLDVFNDFWSDIWISFLQITDPGAVAEDTDSSPWLKVIAVIAGFFGIVIFSMLIAFITTTLENLLHEFRKGRAKVMEKGHSLMLGWNERTIDIIRELILANESEKKATIVILAKEDKESMDDHIAKRITDRKTTSIITTSGDYANMSELNRVSVTEAKSVLIMAACSEASTKEQKDKSDIQTIKAIMAVVSCQQGKNTIPIIAEIFNQEKREIISYFEDPNIIALDSWDIMGKLLVQTSLTSGLQVVYNEILSFDGAEIYFYQAPWNNLKFCDLIYHFTDGVPLGVLTKNKTLVLRPEKDYLMKEEDELLILAEDDSTIQFQPETLFQVKELPLSTQTLAVKSKNTLILGWHNLADIFIRESVDYLEAESVFDVVINKSYEEDIKHIQTIQQKYPSFKIQLITKNPLNLKELAELRPFDYDSVIILSQDTKECDSESIDSDTLVILLLLRKIKQGLKEQNNTQIITQVLNSENQDIITQTDVDDFIISNKLITMILAQLSEEPKISVLYEHLFAESGSEIYVKPAALYFQELPHSCRFIDLMRLVDKRNEICLGVKKASLSRSPVDNFGIRLNISKNEMLEIAEDDFVVVLAEDYM